MVRFLMFEADRARAEQLRVVVKSLFMRLKSSYEMFISHSDKDTLERIQKNPFLYDIVFINADDEGVAKTLSGAIRQRDIKTAIVYLGDDFARLDRLLLFRPSAMLLKTSEPLVLMREIYVVYKEQKKQNRYFLIRNRGEIERIPYEQIDFFESSNRKIYLHTNTGSKIYEFNAKIDDVMKAITVPGFIRCHQSYLINLENVCSIDKIEKRFVTFSGKHVDISKRNLTEAAELFEKYVMA